MTLVEGINKAISHAIGAPFEAGRAETMGGGCINEAMRLRDGAREFFVKTNRASALDMFEAEQAGLEELAAAAALRVPRPVCSGLAGNAAYLVMEYIPMGRGGEDSAVRAGQQLAALHRCTAASFGWCRDNTIGATPQPNAESADWAEFWRERRLAHQLALAARGGYTGRLQRLGDKLIAGFPTLIDHAPVPSLLHGDLWGGNLGYDRDGEPVIFDPAVYFGDRETDLAMTELFGGFPRDFYAAYRDRWPLPDGYLVRKELYNLYHLLNHLNLFGSGYLGQVERTMERLLGELG